MKELIEELKSEANFCESISKLGEISCDNFLGGKVRVFQPIKGFRAGFESVFLAASIPAQAGDKVLEAGSGVGVATICLASRLKGLNVKGVEIDANQVALAAKNLEINKLKSKVSFIRADITAPSLEMERKRISPDSFSHAFANPPFFCDSSARFPKNSQKKLAYIQKSGDLKKWILFLIRVVRPWGSITIIQRAERLPQIIKYLERRAGSIKVVPIIHSNKDKAARTVLIQAIKSSKSPFVLNTPIILQNQEGKYNKIAKAILRKGKALII